MKRDEETTKQLIRITAEINTLKERIVLFCNDCEKKGISVGNCFDLIDVETELRLLNNRFERFAK